MSEDLLRELSVGHIPTSMITVMGVGGAGSNAVNHMWEMGIEGVNFLVCNTDQQALDKSPVENKLRLGREGLGAGNDPEEGRRAAMESLEEVRCRMEALNTRMLFITAGMGGGTGTGASPALARLAREMGILTVGIVTSPLVVEGNTRYNQAMVGIEQMRESVDSLLVLNNENILELYGRLSLKMAFSKADDILCSAAKGIAEIITVESDLVNVDFADVCKVMRRSGRAHMSVEVAEGENRAEVVAHKALNSPLLDNNRIVGAKNILLNFSVASAEDLVLDEVTQVMRYIQSHATTYDKHGEPINANIIWGTSEKPSLGGAMELVLVATGLENNSEEEDQYPEKAQSLEPPKQRVATQRLEPKVTTITSDLDPYKPSTSQVLPPSLSQHPHRQVILGGSMSNKYADIGQLLERPAYKSRNAQFITEVPSVKRETFNKDRGGRRGHEQEDDRNLLFPRLD
ncbi:MAG: cell division protein FtsZ [Rikenellaceae bacterium]